MEKPLISIIIPVYNVEKYLRQCLDSVVNQTCNNFEVICVNDGSTDKSFEILQEYGEKYSDFRIYTQENKGLGTTRNIGVSYSTGDYLYFLDSDDYIELNLIEEVTKIITENPNIDIIKFKGSAFDCVTGERIDYPYITMKDIPKNLFNRKISFDDIIDQNVLIPVNTWLGVYRKDFIKNNNLKFSDVVCAEDVSFSYCTMAKSKSMYFLDKFLINYRKSRKDGLHISKMEKRVVCEVTEFSIIKEVANTVPVKYKKYLLQKDLIHNLFYWFKMSVHTKQGKENYKLLQKVLKDISLKDLDITLDHKRFRWNCVLLSSIKQLPFYMFVFIYSIYKFQCKIRRIIPQ